jgi:hypothetical protein
VQKFVVGQTFLSAGAGDFPVASSNVGSANLQNTGLESPVNRQAGKPALQPLELNLNLTDAEALAALRPTPAQ